MRPVNPPKKAARVRSTREKLERLFQVFAHQDKVLITIDADPDSMASAMALKRLLREKVTSVTLAHFNKIIRSDNLSMVKLLRIPLVKLQEINPDRFSKVLLVDGQPYHHETFNDFKYDAVIDHHPKIMPVKAVFVDIRPNYGATATIMTQYLRSAKIRPSERLATALVYAIKVDTSNFELGAVEEDVKAFRFLFPYSNMHLLHRIEICDMGINDLQYFQEALENRRVIKGKMFSHLGKVPSPDALVLVADFFMKCHEVAWVIVSGICQNTLVVVIRNDGLQNDAGNSAIKAFGSFGSAGGHLAKARAEIPSANLTAHFTKGDHANLADFVIGQFDKCVEM